MYVCQKDSSHVDKPWVWKTDGSKMQMQGSLYRELFSWSKSKNIKFC